ncbi:MAG: nitroreductase family protein [Mobilitalea sp.]
MTELDAIEIRQSRRSYLDTPIEEENIQKIHNYINAYNMRGHLSIQFIEDGREAFQGFNLGYGLFSGVRSYLALVGNTSDPFLQEKIGYYGERIILKLTKLGLGTCWVGGTFARSKCPAVLQEGESLVALITVGNVTRLKTPKEQTIYKFIHRHTKDFDRLFTSDSDVPGWFLIGLKAIQKAPSAMHKQPVHLQIKQDIVTASVKKYDSHQAIDLGIAKLHFEISVGGKFAFGNNAAFTKSR